MKLRRDTLWNLLFSAAIAVLMLGILLSRNLTPPIWVLIAYPAFGALLAHVAGRTCPNRSHIVWLENATIAAACVIVLVSVADEILGALFLDELRAEGDSIARSLDLIVFITLTTSAVMLWWSLERGITRVRSSGVDEESQSEASRRGQSAQTRKAGRY